MLEDPIFFSKEKRRHSSGKSRNPLQTTRQIEGAVRWPGDEVKARTLKMKIWNGRRSEELRGRESKLEKITRKLIVERGAKRG